MRSLSTSAIVVALGLAPACASSEPEPGMIDWREEPHHLSVLLASTMEPDESGGTVGVDYEYRTSQFLGLGAVVEHAFEQIDATTVLAVADLHLTHHVILQTGPGIEFVDGENEFVYRLGALYEFELGDGYTLSPQLHHDWTTGEDAYVAGVALGVGF